MSDLDPETATSFNPPPTKVDEKKEKAPGPAATPSDNAASRSKMNMFAASLVANHTITQRTNSSEFPIRTLVINVTTLHTMFKNILDPICRAIHRSFGLRDLTPGGADDNALQSIIHSVAYEACHATYAVLLHKATRLSPGLVPSFNHPSSATTLSFPIYMTALINSFGPVTLGHLPFRSTYVPVFSWTSLTQLAGNNYHVYRAAQFYENYGKIKTYQSAVVDINVQGSSPWWTYHVHSGSLPPMATRVYSLYSPFRFDETEHALSLGTLFAKNKLTDTSGVINFSASPWQEFDTTPTIRMFSAESFRYPYFNAAQPVVKYFIEGHPSNDPTPALAGAASQDPSYAPQSPNYSSAMDTSESSSAVPSKRARTDEPSSKDKKKLFRVTFHYYDHIRCDDISDTTLSLWSGQLNASA